MEGILDTRLLTHWEESRHRQHLIRRVLEKSSLPPERLESWSLELIGEALSAQYGEENRRLQLADATVSVLSDDR
jgi:hypothetical protein